MLNSYPPYPLQAALSTAGAF